MVRTFALALGLAFLAPNLAHANDYISNRTSDWYRFTDADTGQEKLSQITQTEGNWRLWSEFAGLGPTWVYTSANNDYFYFWNGDTYTYVGNLDGNVGSYAFLDMPPCNEGWARIAWRGQLQTPVGTFNDAVEMTFRTSCADAGTTKIWFAKGVGVVGWTEQSIAGEKVWELTSARVAGQTYSSGQTNPAPSNPGATVAPAEHAPMEAILWGCNDTYIVIDTYIDAFRGLHNHLKSEVVVSTNSVASQLRYELNQANVPLDDVEFIVARIDTVWMRDYGPIILKRPNGQRVVADCEYYPGRPRDDDFPIAYANYRGWSIVDVPVGFEGGNFATDGNGLQIQSNGVLWFNQHLSKGQIENYFSRMGSNRFLWLEPLVDEGTTHVDMFMRILGDDTALVSSYPSSHKQFGVTQAAARQLRNAGYTVTRTTADYRYDEFGTYSNSVLANGVALIPQYTDSTKNRAALRDYQNAGFRPVGIDSRLIIRYSGATHCISMQVPR